MRNFLTRLGLFVSIFCAVAVSNFVFNAMAIRYYPPTISKDILILGDSHMVRAVDPRGLGNAANIAQLSESTVISYFKLRRVLESNRVRVVILSVSYNNLSSNSDNKFVDPALSEEMIRRTYSLISFEEMPEFDVDYKEYCSVLMRRMCLIPHLSHNEFIGRFAPRQTKFKSDSESAIKRHFLKDNEIASVSSLQLDFLQKIVKLTADKGVELVLLEPPLHPTYRDRVPRSFQLALEKIKSGVKREQENVRVIDLTSLFSSDTYFENSDHVNSKGAERVTEELARRLGVSRN